MCFLATETELVSGASDKKLILWEWNGTEVWNDQVSRNILLLKLFFPPSSLFFFFCVPQIICYVKVSVLPVVFVPLHCTMTIEAPCTSPPDC